MSQKFKNPSPLVEAVLSLDTYLEEMVRLSGKIETMDVKSESDAEHTQRLMLRFSECGAGIESEISNLSVRLNEAKARAEQAAQIVSRKAEELQARREDQRDKNELFQRLAEKVRDLTRSLAELKPAEGERPSEQAREKIASRLAQVESRLLPLIHEAQDLKQVAQASRFKEVEQKADALAQSLTAVGRKLEAFKTLKPESRVH